MISEFLEVVVAIAVVLGSLKGAEYYRIRRLRSGNAGANRRMSGSHNPGGLSSGDNDFRKGCFSQLSSDLTIDRLKMERALTDTIREESGKTRSAIYESRR